MSMRCQHCGAVTGYGNEIGHASNCPEIAIVGHKTKWSADARAFVHEPLRADEAQVLLQQAEAAEKRRAEEMPSTEAAISTMWNGYQRLRELGWREAMYCPKDGSTFEVIEAGSTGIFDCHYSGEWPNGHWWAHDGGDLWPSNPILFRPKQAADDATDAGCGSEPSSGERVATPPHMRQR